MQDSIFLQALASKNDRGRPPIWIMRQAGRYMPEYRAIREKHAFLTMCHTPEIAAKVTLQPIHSFGMDAAILFSDILVVPEAFDLGLQFVEKSGPLIERPLCTPLDIKALPNPNIKEKLNYVAKTIRILKKELKVPLIGFCGAPFTLASYMIEGGGNKDLKKTKKWLLQEPASFHQLLEKLTESTIEYLQLQMEAGVNAIQIFDSWANVLAGEQFREFCLPYLKKILSTIQNTPTILFCRGSSVFAKQLAALTPSALSLDWNADLADVRKVIPKNVALQGNLDPDILYAGRAVIQREVKKLLSEMEGDPGYIFNLGHGIKPDMLPEAVRTMVETVQAS